MLKIDKTGPFHAFFSQILEKHPFSSFGPILPPFSRIRAYTRSSRKNTPLYAFSCSRMGTKVELELPPPGVKHNRFQLTVGHLQTRNYKLRIKDMFE